VYESEGAKVGTSREYTSVVFAGAEPLGTGHGATKQEAEQDAARAALESLVGAVKPSSAVKPPRAARTRARRGPKPRETRAEANEAEPNEAEPNGAPEVQLSVLPPVGELEAPPDPGPDPDPEPPRSRQFGAPIE
jgi:hypothetical protein